MTILLKEHGIGDASLFLPMVSFSEKYLFRRMQTAVRRCDLHNYFVSLPIEEIRFCPKMDCDGLRPSRL